MSNPTSNILHPTMASFKAEVLDATEPVLLDFWAPWCPPCRALKPTIEQLAREVEGKAKVAFINVDEQPELAEQFRVESIPALFIVKGGKVVDSLVGMAPKPTLLARLQEWID